MDSEEMETISYKIFKDGVYQKIKPYQRFNVITMCGSTKFKEEYLSTIKELAYSGALVLFCPIFHHADGILIPEETGKMLRDMHMQKIRMADAIFVINKDGYIGSSTREEIEYATSLKKDIFYMEPIKMEEDESIKIMNNNLNAIFNMVSAAFYYKEQMEDENGNPTQKQIELKKVLKEEYQL